MFDVLAIKSLQASPVQKLPHIPHCRMLKPHVHYEMAAGYGCFMSFRTAYFSLELLHSHSESNIEY